MRDKTYEQTPAKAQDADFVEIQTLPTLPEMCTRVAHFYRLAPASRLYEKSRKRKIARPRQVAMFIARRHLKLTYPKIAAHFEKDHTTIIHAEQRIEELSLESVSFARELVDVVSFATRRVRRKMSPRVLGLLRDPIPGGVPPIEETRV